MHKVLIADDDSGGQDADLRHHQAEGGTSL